MIYVMSDIHGNYNAYRQALERIHFSNQDTLYVLGDVIDRGSHSIKILQDMMMYDNIIPLAGNHEYMAIVFFSLFHHKITDEFLDSLNEDVFKVYYTWMQNGGNTTLDEFKSLSDEEKEDIIDYLNEFRLYEQVSVGNENYILVHAGLEPFDIQKPLNQYHLTEMIFTSPDIELPYYPDQYVISGHTPTLLYGKEYKGRIIEKNHHILIDCGCIYGLNLGIYCLDTKEKFYVSCEDF